MRILPLLIFVCLFPVTFILDVCFYSHARADGVKFYSEFDYLNSDSKIGNKITGDTFESGFSSLNQRSLVISLLVSYPLYFLN